jgi:hypothetical protein
MGDDVRQVKAIFPGAAVIDMRPQASVELDAQIPF